MSVFIISYDAHAVRDYDDFYQAMEDKKGVRLLESVWGIELDNTVGEVRDWVRNLLDDDDSIIVIKVTPKPSWATRNSTKAASQWLKDNI